MTPITILRPALAGLAVSLLMAPPALADHLMVPPGSPDWMEKGADALLYLHIGGGTVGLVSGAIAILSPKGEWLHRLAGNFFFAAMLVMSGIGATVAPFLHDRMSTVAGFMTFYLIVTGWVTVQRQDEIGRIEVIGLWVAIAGVISTVTLSWMAAHTPEGTLDGTPPQAFYIFTTVSVIAALSDLKVVLQGGITGIPRIARHVWRMCFGLFVASGSLFLGQQQVFPHWIRETPILYIAALAPLPFLLFWMLRVRFSRQFADQASATLVPATG